MRKSVLSVAFVFCSIAVLAQKDLKPTRSFTISGEVKSSLVIQAIDLKKWNIKTIGDIIITNHLGEKKSEAKGLKGVLLTDVLKGIELTAESPKVLSEFYFVCKANDGYTVVYSWNELFNTVTGKTTFLVTEKEGKSATEMSDAILMISPGDIATGRRYLKALGSIEVKRASR